MTSTGPATSGDAADEQLVLQPVGDLDRVAAADLRAGAAAGRAPVVVVDLAEVRFTDSSGLGGLIALRGELRRDGRDLVLRNPTTQLLRLMSMTQTYDQFRWR